MLEFLGVDKAETKEASAKANPCGLSTEPVYMATTHAMIRSQPLDNFETRCKPPGVGNNSGSIASCPPSNLVVNLRVDFGEDREAFLSSERSPGEEPAAFASHDTSPID